MRVVLIALVVATGVTGSGGVFYSPGSRKSDNDFAARYLSLADASPHVVSRYTEQAVSLCLPEGRYSQLLDAGVKELVTKTFSRSNFLVAQGKDPGQISEEFIPWITKQAETLSDQQKNAYVELLENIDTSQTQFCVLSTVKTAVEQSIDFKAMGWSLRI